uniref:HNH endonuclease n=1 Tax=viral metagenome TaxID=1070528 RepID=A0A6H2A0Y7_9ZZZZ
MTRKGGVIFMSKVIDLIGKKFGRLTVIERLESDKLGRLYWKCKCECGNFTSVLGLSLRYNHTKSCGCLKEEKSKTSNLKHGKTKTRLHGIWVNMRERCHNKNNYKYEDYGGRGIEICHEWDDFMVFYEWSMSNGYQDNLTIDRIDNDGNYEPFNCRWTTMKVQNTNKRTNRNIEFNGKTQCITEWAKELNIPLSTRISKYNMDIDKALTLPKKKYTKTTITHKGKTQSVSQWAKEKNMSYSLLCWRLKRWSIEKSIETPMK